jgi:hypothetical protein
MIGTTSGVENETAVVDPSTRASSDLSRTGAGAGATAMVARIGGKASPQWSVPASEASIWT